MVAPSFQERQPASEGGGVLTADQGPKSPLWLDCRGLARNFPPFLSNVLIKKRLRRSRELKPTHDDGWIMAIGCAREKMTRLSSRNRWIGVAHDLDPVEVRRRIRGKTGLRSMIRRPSWQTSPSETGCLFALQAQCGGFSSAPVLFQTRPCSDTDL